MKLQDRSEVAKYCPNCAPARKLIVRTNRANGTQFLGCPNWPACSYTEPIPSLGDDQIDTLLESLERAIAVRREGGMW